MKNRYALVILAKAPDIRTVKTRLKNHMADWQRTALYVSLLERTIHDLGWIKGVDTFISYSPDEAETYFSSFGMGAFPQDGEDLGEKIQYALKTVLGCGYSGAAIVGVDIPDLTEEVVNEAFRLLSGSDIVFGPSPDGGYYLVGVKKPLKEIFTGVTWSSPETLRQSLALAESAGYSTALLRPLYDVDTIEDARRYIQTHD